MTVGLGFFTPFVEAPPVAPKEPVLVKSGSDTSGIDPWRQGIEVTTEAQRFGTSLPHLGTDDPDNQIELTVFGQSSEFMATVLFHEMTKFNPVAFLQNTGTLTFPVILDNPSFEDPETLGGFIQPLAVPSRDALVTGAEFDLHNTRGALGDGNEDSFGKCCRIFGVRDAKERPQAADLWVDATNTFGSPSGSIVIVGFFPDNERVIRPFDETAYMSMTFVSGSLPGTSSYGIVNALLRMTASTEQYIGAGFVSAGTGFVFGDSPLGTDSLAFGGLLR